MEFDDDLNIQDEPKFVDPDEEFEEECCFWLFKLLRGRNTGRKLKRKLFKYACINVVIGFPLLVLTAYEERQYGKRSYYTTKEHGASLITLQYWASMLALIICGIIWIGLKYWASLVTNRELLQKMLTCILIYGVFQFIFTLWATCVLFLVFKGVDWENDEITEGIFVAFIFSIIFLLPFSITIPYYMLDMSYLSGEIDLRGDISEPEVPENTMDLSNVLLKDICGALLALPFIVCIQLSSMCDCCARFLLVFQREPRTIEEEAERQEREEARMDRVRNFSVRGVFASLYGIVSGPGKRSRTVVPSQGEADEEAPSVDDHVALQDLRERDRTAADALAASSPPEPQDELESEDASPILSVQQFKALWPALGVAGSFQCKLRSAPNMQILTTHLRKQNFNVVFASSPSDKETEVSICNIKESPGEAWFMARFLFTSSLFSAVMKAQDADVVEAHVRRFALAKVLKIDTS